MKGFGGVLRRLAAFAVLILSCQLVSCQISDEDRPSAKTVSKSINQFASDLYTVLRSKHKNNLIYSPISLSSVMAMVQAGAKGNTAKEITAGMRFPEDKDTLNRGNRAILASLKSNENFTLEAANRVYAQKGFELQEEFSNTLREFFNTTAELLNFSDSEKSAKIINDWVEGITHDKIKDLLSSSDLGPLTRLVLVNAIYFKGQWKNKFDAEKTLPAPFYTSENKNVTVDMMKIDTEIPYVELADLKAKAVSIPYKGDRLSMVIVLPDDKEGLPDLEDKLKTVGFADISKRLFEAPERKVILSLPRFKLESTIDLEGPLKELKMTSMFSKTTADFSGIGKSKEELHISKAIQKAFIEVNEEGSEAAAATGVIIMTRSGNTIRFKKVEFVVDHPFLAYIYDWETESTLFITTSSDPTETSTEIRAASSVADNDGIRPSVSWFIFPILLLKSLLL